MGRDMTNEDKEVGCYHRVAVGRMIAHIKRWKILSAVFCRALISYYRVFSMLRGLIFWLQDHPRITRYAYSMEKIQYTFAEELRINSRDSMNV